MSKYSIQFLGLLWHFKCWYFHTYFVSIKQYTMLIPLTTNYIHSFVNIHYLNWTRLTVQCVHVNTCGFYVLYIFNIYSACYNHKLFSFTQNFSSDRVIIKLKNKIEHYSLEILFLNRLPIYIDTNCV